MARDADPRRTRLDAVGERHLEVRIDRVGRRRSLDGAGVEIVSQDAGVDQVPKVVVVELEGDLPESVARRPSTRTSPASSVLIVARGVRSAGIRGRGVRVSLQLFQYSDRSRGVCDQSGSDDEEPESEPQIARERERRTHPDESSERNESDADPRPPFIGPRIPRRVLRVQVPDVEGECESAGPANPRYECEATVSNEPVEAAPDSASDEESDEGVPRRSWHIPNNFATPLKCWYDGRE